MNVLLLSGGKSIERDVSLRSGQTIAQSLSELGYEYENFDPVCTDDELVAKAQQFDVVFIALHGKPGEDGTIQALFEQHNIPFQGSGSTASKLCIDKSAFKNFVGPKGILLPEGKLVSSADIDDPIFDRPYVLKPNTEGSSLDTQIVRRPQAAHREQRIELLKKYPTMLAEQLIDGTEITVGVYRDAALPVIEIIPPSEGEFDYENKYNGKTQELLPPLHVSADTQREAQELALRIHHMVGCKDMSRTDFIVKDDLIYTLETNTIPGMTEQSLLPKMLRAAGFTMPEFVKQSLESAVSRLQ